MAASRSHQGALRDRRERGAGTHPREAEGKEILASRSAWTCLQASIHSSPATGCTRRPPASSRSSPPSVRSSYSSKILHWAEEELLDLVDRLLADVTGPLFVIATSRPEILDVRPAWGGGKRNVTLLGLEPLTETQTEEMVSGLLAAELPEPVRAALVERAGGNPFFVEELVATLIDHGVLERSNGGWKAEELPAGFEIPDSCMCARRAHRSPAAIREGRAPGGCRRGRTFWPSAVRQLVDADPSYELLEERDFIRRRPGSTRPGEREYAIKHALTREVAYATLPKARRARLHAALAGWMERSREAREEQAALLGHHYAEAVKPEDADLAGPETTRSSRACAPRRSSGCAGPVSSQSRATSSTRRSCSCSGLSSSRRTRETQARLWHMLGRAHALKYDAPRFSAAMERAIELTDDDTFQGICTPTWRTTRPAAEECSPCSQPQKWSRVGSTGRSSSPSLGVPRRRRRSLRAPIGDGHANFHRTAGSNRASALVVGIDDPDLEVVALNDLVLSSVVAGEYDDALVWVERAHELIEESGIPT
jgi:hypothetical protein